jgi:thioredoxin 1
MRRRFCKTFISFLAVFFLFFSGTWVLADPSKPVDVPVKGMVTMLDLGAGKCIPCKMMEPILEKLEKDYEGRAAIVFIDIRYRTEEAERYNIRTIPTQIFFDEDGNEAYRHEGFLSEQAIVEQLRKMGVE